MENRIRITSNELKNYIEMIEKLEQEKKDIHDKISEMYAKARGSGWNVKVIKQLIKLRKMSNDDREEQETLLNTYKHALGMDFIE